MLVKASIKLLRLTVPADLYTSGIVAEVDGVEIRLALDTQSDDDPGGAELKAKKDELKSAQRRTSTDRPRSLRPKIHDPGGGPRIVPHGIDGGDDSPDSAALPTTDDLAKSFLHAEPRKEKAELQAAVAQSQQIDASDVLDDPDQNSTVGMGNGLSLPAFLSGFLTGIGDRFRLELHNVKVDIVLRIEMPSENSLATAINDRSEDVTLRLSIKDVEYANGPRSDLSLNIGSARSAGSAPRDSSSGGETGWQVRMVRCSEIQGAILSDASIFSSLLPSIPPSSSSESTLAGSPSNARRETQPPEEELAEAPRNTNDQGDMDRLSDASPDETSSFSGLSQRSDSSNDLGLSQEPDITPMGAVPYLIPTLERGTLPKDTASDALYSNDRRKASEYEGIYSLQTPPKQRLSKRSTTTTQSSTSSADDKYSPNITTITGTEWQYARRDRKQRGSELSTKSSSPASQDDSGPPTEDLAQSKIFSHEEAESMYMSAMSTVDPTVHSVEQTMPGAWDTRVEDDHTAKDASAMYASRVSSRQASEHGSDDPGPTEPINDGRDVKPPHLPPSHSTNDTTDAKDINVAHVDEVNAVSDRSTLKKPPGKTSNPSEAETEGSLTVSKLFMTIDQVSIELPHTDTGPTPPSPLPAQQATTTQTSPAHTKSKQDQSEHVAVPRDVEGPIFPSAHEGPRYLSEAATTIKCGVIGFKTDMGLARLTALIIRQMSKIFPSHTSTKEKDRGANAARQSEIRMTVDRIAWCFYDRVVGSPAVEDFGSIGRLGTESAFIGSELLLKATVRGLESVSQTTPGTDKSQVSLDGVSFGYASGDIVSFDSALKLRESTRDILAPANKDLVLTISKDARASKIELTTRPIHVRLDLRRLDETFAWLGGFSSILDLGNSMISTVTTLDPAKERRGQPRKSSRGVRFESPGSGAAAKASAPPDLMLRKVTARVGGLTCELLGSESTLRLDGTALKVVSRAEGLGLQVDRIHLSGLYLQNHRNQPAIVAQFFNVRIEYLPEPKEVDLARLLALLSPSRDKYEVDDDILLDTLLRQRRQGGVIRLTAERSENRLSDLNHLQHFATLAEELKKLGTVTKYLPEDDRPGILTLVLIRQLRCEAQIGGSLGLIEADLKIVELADVTLPSLFALGISSVHICRNGNEELVTTATPVERQEDSRPPMVMARFVGNEMEPTVKLKLHDVCVEYQVPFVLAIMDSTGSTQPEDLLTDMAGSIANLTELQRWKDKVPDSPRDISASSGKSSPAYTALRIDITIRDSLIGLNPRKSSAKGMVVLMETHFAGTVPKDQEANATLEIRRAALMIIDDQDNIKRPGTGANHVLAQANASQLQILEAMGYVSISSISAARALLQITHDPQSPSKFIDVEIKDDLFVLESCADSTQTLQTILNGLAPPIPRSKDVRYRTEVVPIEDMLSAFSGMAFTANGAMVESGEEADFPHENIQENSDDEDPEDQEIGNSFYDLESSRQYDGVSDSMLDEESDSVMVNPSTQITEENSSLSGSYNQSQDAEAEGPPLEFQDDHFGSSSSVGGTAHRWNTKRNTHGLSNEARIRKSPLRVRARDVHVIWNLFDGYDWQRTRETISKAIADIEGKALIRQSKREKRKPQDEDNDEESVIGDFLFNSIYIGVPANKDPRSLSRQVSRNLDDIASESESSAPSSVSSSPNRPRASSPARSKRPRLARSKHHKMTFELKGISVDLVVFPPGSGETQSSIDVRVQDLEIFDHVPTSTWKKFATYMHDAGERESGASMIHLEILNVRPVPDLAASEIMLKATILPLRLHVDQDALDFMTRFFEFKDGSAKEATTKSEEPFLQRVEVNSVRLRLDFKPKRVDYAGIRSGHTNEFMNFFILDRADMVLRHVIIYGISGFDRLGKTLNDIWMPDIKRNQLPGILAGLAPVRSLVNVGSGVRDLVVVPIREYQKDGRIVRSLQKGALAFAKTTTSELVKLGAKLAIGTQTVLQSAEDLLTQPDQQRSEVGGGWEDAELDEDEKKHISLYADQPIGVVQGLRGAYASLERDLLTAKDAIVAMPGEVLESGTAGGAAKAVLRGAPTVILRPALGVSKAVGRTLMGATNSLDTENRRRIEEVSDISRVYSIQGLADFCRNAEIQEALMFHA